MNEVGTDEQRDVISEDEASIPRVEVFTKLLVCEYFFQVTNKTCVKLIDLEHKSELDPVVLSRDL